MNELILSPAIKLAVDYVIKKIPAAREKLRVDVSDLEVSLAHHIKSVNNWSNSIGFRDSRGSKQLASTVFDLNLSLSIKKHNYEQEQKKEMKISELFDFSGHTIILGDPGAGKTTTIKYLCQRLIHNEEIDSEVSYSFPILIRLRELKAEGIYERLSNILDVRIVFPNVEKQPQSYQTLMRNRIISTYLEELKPVVFLDGFDEVPTSRKDDLISEFRELVLSASNFKVILTCRSGEFDYFIDNSSVVELLPLTIEEIPEFVFKWLQNEEKKKDFIAKLVDKPYFDTTIRPLTLSHLCAIYERTDSIPDRPKTVYKKIVNMLLQEWDEERGINRTSKYANFDKERKAEFLSSFAYELTKRFGTTVFDKEQFRFAYLEINRDFELPDSEVKEVVKEIESHTGLIIKAGATKYEFAHKSLQEFLCADYIVRLHEIPQDIRLIHLMPNEFAIAVSLSSHPSEYLSYFILNVLSANKIDAKFYGPFLSRLRLERPDFKPYFLLGVAAMQLFTLAVFPKGIVDEDSIADVQKVNMMNRVFDLNQIQESISLMGHVYKAKETISMNSNKYIRLLLTENIPENFGCNLPGEIFAPSSTWKNED